MQLDQRISTMNFNARTLHGRYLPHPKKEGVQGLDQGCGLSLAQAAQRKETGLSEAYGVKHAMRQSVTTASTLRFV